MIFSAVLTTPLNTVSNLLSASPLFSCSAFFLSYAAVSSASSFLPANISAIEFTEFAIAEILSSTFEVVPPGNFAPIFSPLVLLL